MSSTHNVQRPPASLKRLEPRPGSDRRLDQPCTSYRNSISQEFSGIYPRIFCGFLTRGIRGSAHRPATRTATAVGPMPGHPARRWTPSPRGPAASHSFVLAARESARPVKVQPRAPGRGRSLGRCYTATRNRSAQAQPRPRSSATPPRPAALRQAAIQARTAAGGKGTSLRDSLTLALAGRRLCSSGIAGASQPAASPQRAGAATGGVARSHSPCGSAPTGLPLERKPTYGSTIRSNARENHLRSQRPATSHAGKRRPGTTQPQRRHRIPVLPAWQPHHVGTPGSTPTNRAAHGARREPKQHLHRAHHHQAQSGQANELDRRTQRRPKEAIRLWPASARHRRKPAPTA